MHRRVLLALCLYACPPDAVLHWNLDKRGCAQEAQEFGFGTIAAFFDRFPKAPGKARPAMLRSRDLFGFWQGLLRVVGSFGDCPRCLEVCPVGNDYHAFLAGPQKHIPERTPEKVAKAKAYKRARAGGDEVPGLDPWNIRWVGPDGYRGNEGVAAREFRAFRERQTARGLAVATPPPADRGKSK